MHAKKMGCKELQHHVPQPIENKNPNNLNAALL